MESLSEILSGDTAPDTNASAPETKVEPVTDVKPAEGEKPDAPSAPSAEQAKTDESKAEDKTEGDDKSDDKTRDEKGRFKTDEKDKSVKPDEIASLRKALQAERKKRQELEQRAKEQPKDEKPKTDFWTDPDAAVEERLSAREEKLRRESETRFFSLCEKLAKAKHDDYEAVVESLIQETENDPNLARQVFSEARQSDDPAEFLYSTAKHRSEMKAVGGDLGKYKESVEAPLREQVKKLEAEKKALEEKLEKLGKVPSSLNAQPSATRASVELEATEDESLEEIAKPRKRRA